MAIKATCYHHTISRKRKKTIGKTHHMPSGNLDQGTFGPRSCFKETVQGPIDSEPFHPLTTCPSVLSHKCACQCQSHFQPQRGGLAGAVLRHRPARATQLRLKRAWPKGWGVMGPLAALGQIRKAYRHSGFVPPCYRPHDASTLYKRICETGH